MKRKKIVRLILGDQLNINHSWFKKVDADVTYALMEVKSESEYVHHHIQKVIGFFAAMRNFAKELQDAGHRVIYISINDRDNQHQFDLNCESLINKYKFDHFEYLLPDEYRLDEHLKSFTSRLPISSAVADTEHFYCSRKDTHDFFADKKTYIMETFYRYMRKRFKILVDAADQPIMGKWNFDESNRKKLPKNHRPIAPLFFSNDLSEIEQEIKSAGITTIGNVDSKKFLWPINRKQTLKLLAYFNEHCLKYFGTFQDAMSTEEWSLYHSRLSFSLNIKLISPQEVVNSAIQTYYKNQTEIEFHQLEGFVRQIIGWREFMRGIYWLKMPDYAELNYFNHRAALPDWFWTGKTKMNCLKHAINQSLDHAYAHHIQRLMVTGNFALLIGCNPDEVDAWYLGIYIDAIQWVEITNTRGMSQYADGGIIGTKPYVSSAAYIHKMSNYCEGCYYDHKKKTGERACPFNSLYWNFYDKHEGKLKNNPRIGMMYSVWNKMNPDTKAELLEQANFYLKNIHSL